VVRLEVRRVADPFEKISKNVHPKQITAVDTENAGKINS
jgi:hypothetical protein